MENFKKHDEAFSQEEIETKNAENIVENENKTEVLVTSEEIDFFREFTQEQGYKKSLALARLLNEPYVNINIPEERQSLARKRSSQRGHDASSEEYQRPELGGFEYHTASIIARTFEKSIRKAEEERIIRGSASINVIDHGEHKWLSLQEYQERVKDGKEGLLIVAVVGEIEGDDAAGPNILIRNDMDALQMASGEIKHQCGHNVHSGWAAMNVDGMIEYKKHFGNLPFRKVIFVSEANEEANPAAEDLVSPKELLESGFEERYGKADIVMGAHVIASLPENTFRIEEEGFHGATDFIYHIQPNDLYQQNSDNDLRLLGAEVSRLINEEYHADDPNEHFGKHQLVENDDGKIVPQIYVRLTAMQEAQQDSAKEEYKNLALNSLVGSDAYEGRMRDSVLTSDDISQIAERHLQKWNDLHFDVHADISVDSSSGEFSIAISTKGSAHVAFGGPNPRQIMGEVLQDIEQKTKILSHNPSRGIKFGGTMRIRRSDYSQVKDDVSANLHDIFNKAAQNLGLEGKVNCNLTLQNSIAPVINNPGLVRQARALVSEAGIQLTRTGLPHAGAESFAEYERFFHSDEEKKMIYLMIGGMKKETVDQYLQTKDPIPLSCVHHSDEFQVQDSAMPYGITLDALAIQVGRQWKIDREKQRSSA